jgi:uncharacterized membrane protein
MAQSHTRLTEPTVMSSHPLMANRVRMIGHALLFVLAVAIALFSYRYLLDLPPIPPNIASNRYRSTWLVTHAGFAATALLTGAVQFSRKVRQRHPTVHRVTGRVYVAGCLLGAPAGLILSLGSAAGPIAAAGFGTLSILWFVTSAIGWQRASARQYLDHRRWMIRSWALTLSAVTLRLYLPLSEMADLPEMPAYRAISFLCWVPNLLVAEVLLWWETNKFLEQKGLLKA